MILSTCAIEQNGRRWPTGGSRLLYAAAPWLACELFFLRFAEGLISAQALQKKGSDVELGGSRKKLESNKDKRSRHGKELFFADAPLVSEI
jgi:hypothetical protein